VPATEVSVRRQPESPWVALGGDALKALLAAPTLARTAHFALQVHPARPVAQELPTNAAPDRTESVDNHVSLASSFLGVALVVPKRHAKRAVTRNLVKRQMREAIHRRRADWAGLQVMLRLRSAIGSKQFTSASSDALRQAVRSELEQLFSQAAVR